MPIQHRVKYIMFRVLHYMAPGMAPSVSAVDEMKNKLKNKANS